MNKFQRLIFNIISVIIGMFLWYYALRFVSDSVEYVGYNAVWDWCRNDVYLSFAGLIGVTILNLFNYGRIIKQYKEDD